MALKRIAGPAFLAASATNIYTPPNAAVYIEINHIRIANVTAAARSATLYIGATGGSAAGTELCKAESIPANGHSDIFVGRLYMQSSDFLSGLADQASSLTILVMGQYHAV